MMTIEYRMIIGYSVSIGCSAIYLMVCVQAVKNVYVKRKVQVQTILGFCSASLGSTRNHLGSHNQISAICGFYCAYNDLFINC